jgi:hypothetical protein
MHVPGVDPNNPPEGAGAGFEPNRPPDGAGAGAVYDVSMNGVSRISYRHLHLFTSLSM